MCGRNSFFNPQPKLEERFDATAQEPIRPRYNIAPREDLAVVRNDEPDTIDRLEWGFLPQGVDDPDESPRPINARSETVDEKPMFRDTFEKRRCLVLSSGFYEWQEQPGASKQPYRICLADDEPFAFAGLWEHWKNGDDQRETVLDPYAGEDLRTYPISRAVNSPDNDAPEVIEPIDAGEQSGLDEFA